jgi:hypothetical protein
MSDYPKYCAFGMVNTPEVVALLVLQLLLPALSLLLCVAGIVSVVRAGKQGNTKLLWIIVIILAPILGPLLWFIWGKANT